MNLLEQVINTHKPDPLNYPQTIIVCTHAKRSTLELCQLLKDLGLEVIFYPVSYSKEADNLDKLLSIGVQIVELPELLGPYIEAADCVIEDGARISKLIAKQSIHVKKNFYAVEQTSGGIRYFNENSVDYPVINVAMSPMKLEIENKRATPEGIIHYFTHATGKLFGGKQVMIIGFGSIGEGISRLLHTLGAHITVYDTFASKRMFARQRGYSTVEEERFSHVLASQDIIFTATNAYQGTLIGVEQILAMKDGAILCNAGSGRGELAKELQIPGSYTTHDATMQISEVDGHLEILLSKANLQKTIVVLGRSFPINLHLGNGTSHDAIEIIMSLLMLAALTGPESKSPGLQPLTNGIQERIAQCFLRTAKPHEILTPIYVRTRELKAIRKPYGDISPFHDGDSHIINLSVARAKFKPGTKTRGHYHQRTQESYYVENGSADILVWPVGKPDELTAFPMQKGDYLVVPENYFHDVRVTSTKSFTCLVIATPPFDIWDQFFYIPEEAQAA